jgi:outer membrane protein assembly factor BamB
VGNRIPILSRVESAASADPDIANVAVVVPLADENAEWAQPGGSANKASGNLALAKRPGICGPRSRRIEPRRAWPRRRCGGGHLFIFDTNGMLHAFDAKTGAQMDAQLRTAGKLGRPCSAAAPAMTTAASMSPPALAKWPRWMRRRARSWKVARRPAARRPTVAFGTVFVMTQNNEIHALNADDGTELWQEAASLGQTGVFGVARRRRAGLGGGGLLHRRTGRLSL